MGGRMENVLDRLEEVLARLDAMERAQKRSNSRIIRAALVASAAAQGAQFMILVNSTSWAAAAGVVLLIALNAWMISRVAPSEGRKEWPQDELNSYEPYEYGK